MSEAPAEDYVYRYLKKDHIKEDSPWPESECSLQVTSASATDFIQETTFDLREREEHISFFCSKKESDLERILDALNELQKRSGRRDRFPVKSGMMRINHKIACEDINDPKKLITLADNDPTEADCRHYGLFIHAETDLERLEVINSLIELSKFFALRKMSNGPDRRNVMELFEGKYFKLIGEKVAIT